MESLVRFKGAQFISIGSGEAKPIADNSNYQGRNQNRRVEIKVRGQRN
jgi:outer membrane protein OmpA-like peptidoglycan-associated protein